MVRVQAVVVTFNRKDLLRNCLWALLRQTFSVDRIWVINNASTDGTREMLESEFGQDPRISQVHLSENLGGSAGFAIGTQRSLATGADYVWLMDDDAEPLPDALSPLVCSMTSRPGAEPGFVAATVIGEDDIPLRAHWSPELRSRENHDIRPNRFEKAVPYATFVGVLVNAAVARRTWLPVSSFFLWWDDTEYTARLQRLAGGLVNSNSRVKHPEKAQLRDLGDRFSLDVRNRIWMLRSRRLSSPQARRRAASTFPSRLRKQWRFSVSRRAFWAGFAKGCKEGITRTPKAVLPGDAGFLD